MIEPRDIKAEFFEIAKILKQASIALDVLVIGQQQSQAAKKVGNYNRAGTT
jgi:hypothetical protein